MRHITLQTLTWGTVAAAVGSALWLAASEPGWPEARSKYVKPGSHGLRLVSDSVEARGVVLPRLTERGQPAQPGSR